MRDEHDDTRDDALSELYASTRTPDHTPAPSAATEARILAAAREAAPAPKRQPAAYLRWAGAAVFVLAVGIAWRGLQPEAPLPAAPAASQPAPLAETTPSGADAMRQEAARVQASKQSERHAAEAVREARGAAIAAFADGALQTAMPAASPVAPPPEPDADANAGAGNAAALAEPVADARLDPVRTLVAEGRREEARRKLEAMMATQDPPELDEGLRALLYDEQPPSPARAAESPELQR